MTRTHWRNLSLLPWLILPAMLWRYWQAAGPAAGADCSALQCQQRAEWLVRPW